MEEKPNFWNENGQSLIIIALIMVALIAMLALVLDGGNIFFQRRNAQNAADAAAIAGANAYCKASDPTTAFVSGRNAAIDYAGRNDFTLSDFTVVVSPTQINVTTTDTFDTFFGGVIGWPQMTVEAQASAGCCTPMAAKFVMPIAWACYRPSTFVNDSGGTDIDPCIAQVLPEQVFNTYIDSIDDSPPYPYHKDNGEHYKFYKELYIVMDSSKEPDDLASTCWQYDDNGDPIDTDPFTAGMQGIDCDFDNDGENDLISTGDRSWVDLDGGGGGAEDLKTWVTKGLTNNLDLPVWVDGQPGVADKVFSDINSLKDNYFLIPVFDAWCKGDPATSTECSSPYAGEEVLEYNPNGFTYRLQYLAVFYVTCVDSGGQDICPGHEYISDHIDELDPLDVSGWKNNTKTIEGYFVDKNMEGNLESDCTGNTPSFGVDTIRLTR